MPNHNPFMIAHRIAQLDQMARGRFHWGVGSGDFQAISRCSASTLRRGSIAE